MEEAGPQKGVRNILSNESLMLCLGAKSTVNLFGAFPPPNGPAPASLGTLTQVFKGPLFLSCKPPSYLVSSPTSTSLLMWDIFHAKVSAPGGLGLHE